MFFTLGTMLVFSTGIILYASLFTSPEARFLLCSPARADQIFATKFQAAVAFSSWGFVILGVPIFLAYGIIVRRAVVLLRTAAAVSLRLRAAARLGVGRAVPAARALHAAEPQAVLLARRRWWSAAWWRVWLYRVGLGIRQVARVERPRTATT